MSNSRIFLLPLFLVLPIASFAEDAAVSDEEYVASVSTDGLYIRKIMESGNAVIVGARLGIYAGDSNSNNDYSLGIDIGYRAYMSHRGVNSYIDGIFGYTKYDADFKSYGVSVIYGVEHYITDNFSIEGGAGVEIRFVDSGVSDSTNIYLPTSRLAVNYLF